ncbi:MAG: hypothetical protein RR949_01860, partial [Oscillospiraceae bacterium]
LCLSAALTLSLSVSAAAADSMPTVAGEYSLIKVVETIDISELHTFHSGLAAVKKISEEIDYPFWTYLTTDGKFVDWGSDGQSYSGYDFCEGLAPCIRGGHGYELGYMNPSGQTVVGASYNVYHSRGVLTVGRFENGNVWIFTMTDAFSYDPHAYDDGMKGYWTKTDRYGNELSEKSETIPAAVYKNGENPNGVTTETVSINGKQHTLKFSEGHALVDLGPAVKNKNNLADYQQCYIVKKNGATPPAQWGERAQGRTTAVTFNNAAMKLPMYAILGHNYIKLRDFATLINGTPKQFSVGYDGTKNTISLEKGKPYVAVGNEMALNTIAETKAYPCSSPIFKDGYREDLLAFTVGSNNYFQLRDLCYAFDFFVDYDSKTGTVILDTSKDYHGY